MGRNHQHRTFLFPGPLALRPSVVNPLEASGGQNDWTYHLISWSGARLVGFNQCPRGGHLILLEFEHILAADGTVKKGAVSDCRLPRIPLPDRRTGHLREADAVGMGAIVVATD